MNFAVIPFDKPKEDFIETVTDIDSGAYLQYQPNVIFVRFSGTAASLAGKLGFTEATGPNDGIVIAAKDYFGYGKADLWGWLDQ